MKAIFKFIKQCSSVFIAFVLLAGCTSEKIEKTTPSQSENNISEQQSMKYEVEPETFSLSVYKENSFIPVSLSAEKRLVENFSKTDSETKWEYPQDKIAVCIKPEKDYLHVTITSKTTEDNQFQWPNISGETYFMPFGEGKRIPATDKVWNDYLKGQQFTTLEQFSMPFWAATNGNNAILYIMENPYRNDLVFSEENTTSFGLIHQYPEIDSKKENSFRIYLTDNDPVTIAKIYRQYVIEQNNFVTLEQKAEQNPNIKKLYGAPHIYLWGDNIITPENIEWSAFRNSLDNDIINYLMELAPKTETGEEVVRTLEEIKGQDYVSEYQKNIVCRFLSEVLKYDDFYNPQVLIKQDEFMKTLLQKEKETKSLDKSALIQFNKHALAANLSDVFHSTQEWMKEDTVDLIDDLKQSGIEQAWIGLNSWEQAYAKPELVETAVKQGYLIGPYDSYHSIHEPEKEQWITAKFEDTSLYENATVLQKDGEKAKGFQNVGRKLNPIFSIPSVKQRVEEILSTGIVFNSWFIDCDATGEIYDDYTSEHRTTQQEDLEARLKRMALIRDNYNMVIGSEGGNDFAASIIAFAHGIELKSFSWIDDDMKNNKDSEYYIGKYYSSTGGVAEHFSKRIPIKEQYYTIFVDPKYDLPLFKLVYNDSVITSYHWDWSTFKIIGAVGDCMLREILYNTPPLYHLDKEEWNNYKEDISAHTKVWSQFSKQAITQEMTDFKYLSEDGAIQMSKYGENLSVVANFGDSSYTYDKTEIPAHSLLLKMNGETLIYSPDIKENNQ